MTQWLSTHFALGEFIRGIDPAEVGPEIIDALERLCLNVLEPARAGIGLPIRITSGYRPPEKNAATPGAVATSDHQRGMAADCQVVAGDGNTWEQNTVRLAQWIRDHMAGRFGQLILEDHRKALENPYKLWVHVSLPTEKHPGDHDANRLLYSWKPGPEGYLPLGDDHLA